MNILSLDKYFVLCKSDESSSLFSVFVRAKIVSSSIRYFSINASGRFGEKAEERKEAGSKQACSSANASRSLDPKRLHEIQSHRQMDRSAVKHTRGEARTAPLSNNSRLFGFHYRRDAPKEHDPKVPITVCTHRPHTLYNLTAGCGSTPIRVFE